MFEILMVFREYELFLPYATFPGNCASRESSFAQGHDAIWRSLSISSPLSRLKKSEFLSWRNATIFSSRR